MPGFSDFLSGANSAAQLFGTLFGGGGTTTTTGAINGTQDTKSKVTRLDPALLEFIKSQFTAGQFSKQTAITDSNALVTNAIQQALRDALPSIAAASKGSGMTGSSMSQLLAQQASIQGGIQGAALQQNNINAYNDNLVNLINALTNASPVTSTTKQKTHQDPVTQTSSQEGLCFITTAACVVNNKPDDCYELKTLRRFRDTYMRQHKLEYLTKQYYEEAASITAMLDSLVPDVKDCLLMSCYNSFILPAVVAIDEGRNGDALALYVTMFIGLKTLLISLVSGE